METCTSEQLIVADGKRSGLSVHLPLDSHSSTEKRGIVNELLRLLPFEKVPDPSVAGHDGAVMTRLRTHGVVAVFLLELAVSAEELPFQDNWAGIVEFQSKIVKRRSRRSSNARNEESECSCQKQRCCDGLNHQRPPPPG